MNANVKKWRGGGKGGGGAWDRGMHDTGAASEQKAAYHVSLKVG